jgi:ribokinase
VLEPGVGPERPEKRLLKGVLGRLPTKQAHEVTEDLLAVVVVEPLEGRNRHSLHHLLKRSGRVRCETDEMRIGVVGHVEWVQFLRVARVPARGDILQASSGWEEAGGGGSVAAAEIARLAGAATLFTVLGDDDWGHRAKAELEGLGVRVEAVFRPEPQRRAITFADDGGERTITLVGDKLRPRFEEPLPWEELASFDGIYFTAGDPEVLHAARRARILVATARELPTLLAAPELELDAVVSSANDPSEKYSGELQRTPRLVVRTDGASGGTYEPGEGRWVAAPLPGALVDSYGAGDCLAAGLTVGLAEGRAVPDALALAADSAARALTRRGAHGAPNQV